MSLRIYSTIVICIILAWPLTLHAQRIYYVKEVNNYSQPDKRLFPKSTKLDSLSIIINSNIALNQYKSRGYVLASIDSIVFAKDTCSIWWYSGLRFEYGEISMDDNTRMIVKSAGLNKYNWNSKNVDSLAVASYLLDAINYLINNGYPFAKSGFRDVNIVNEKVNLRLEIERGRYIVYDTIELTGKLRLNKNYLHRYLNIMPGKAYSHIDVQNSRKLLRNIQFAQLKSDPVVSFVNDLAILNLNLDESNASRFDFIIGVLPGNAPSGGRGVLITGELLADLQNKFGAGERINVLFRRLEAEDQEIRMGVSYPYLLNSSYGADFSFELKRNRGLSIDLNTTIGGQYIIDGNSFLRVFWNLRSGRLTRIDTTRLIQTRRLPPNLDFNYSGGGLEFLRQKLDYRFNPSSGWEFSVNIGAGVRTIVKNNGITSIKTESVDFSGVYDSLNLSTLQLNAVVSGSYFIPLANRFTIRNGISGGIRFDQGKALENEIFRIGGNRLLRGFDELSIFTNLYAVYTAEFRLLLDRNSFLSLPFVDISRMRVLIEGQPQWDTAFGIGMGLNFATQVGIFNLSFAAGRRLDNPLNFQDAKVHFGYVNIF